MALKNLSREVLIDGVRFRIHIRPDETLELIAGEETVACGSYSIEELRPNLYFVLLKNRGYTIRLDTAAGKVHVGSSEYAVEVVDPREPRKRGNSLGHDGVQTLVSPMPGKVVRVLVNQGDEVAPGDGVLVIEAMKMQNELKAAKAGRVVSIPVSEGATVGAGDVLAVIE